MNFEYGLGITPCCRESPENEVIGVARGMEKKTKAKDQRPSKGISTSASAAKEQSRQLHPIRQKVIVHSSPSIDAWRKLYQLADEIKIVAPWKWMDELQIFALQIDPEDELVYCSIMGNGGEFSGIALYFGAVGLESYNAIQELLQDPFDLYLSQNCLMLTYDDSDLLKEEDKQLFKKLGSKYRGKGAYPLFRFLEPGFEPWFLSDDQAQFLIVALPKLIDVAKTVKYDTEYLFNDEGLIRLFALDDRSEAPRWKDSWIPGYLPPEESQQPRLDEMRVNRILKNCQKAPGVWELDYFYSPGLIQNKPKPFYMQVAMIVDKEEGTVVGYDLIMDDAHETVVAKLFDAMEKFKLVPRKVHVYKDDLYYLLEGMSKLFGFEISLVDELPSLSNMREVLADAIS